EQLEYADFCCGIRPLSRMGRVGFVTGHDATPGWQPSKCRASTHAGWGRNNKAPPVSITRKRTCPSHLDAAPQELGAAQLRDRYSTTSSARARKVGGNSMPSTLAVLRLIRSVNRVDCSIGS